MNRSAASAVAGCVIAAAMLAAGMTAMLGRLPRTAVAWPFPIIGSFHFAMTPFSGFFLVAAGIVALPTSVYSAAYLARYEDRYSIGWFTAGYVLLLISIAGILAAADVVSFTISWEVMTLASCGLVAFEWRESAKIRAGLLMLGMSEFGTLFALLAFLLAARPAHALDFGAIEAHAAAIPPATVAWIVLLSFFGFGVKAGVLPFNTWLPHAHPAAPANVSALLSGVILNLGVYGMLLVNLILVPQGALLFGTLALIVGTLSAIVGILYATIDNDLKRVLAFSSIENLGIVVAAIGIGAVFLSMNRLQVAALGIGAGLWHMGNHALYKSLLFLGAGAVDARVGTRDVNLLGGLAKALPVTSACFLVGALAIAAVPPLNGFASEWLALETLLRGAELGPLPFKIGFVVAGALLALTAALAVTCFVKSFAMTFLGSARSEVARNVRGELSAAAGAGMSLLAIGCIVAGLFPAYVVQLIDSILPGALRGELGHALLPPFLRPNGGYLPHPFVSDFQALGARIGAGVIPGDTLVLMHRGAAANPVVFAMSSTYIAAFAFVLLLTIGAFAYAVSRRGASRSRVWAGGLRTLLPGMAYTGTGFSNPVRVIFEAILSPRTVENTRQSIAEHFRVAVTRRREETFLADRIATNPLVAAVRTIANTLARIHHGRLEGYVLYALGALTVALTVMVLR